MPETACNHLREFLLSANQALKDLEEATGIPVLVVEATELNVLATIRRAGPQEAAQLLRFLRTGQVKPTAAGVSRLR